MMQHDARRRGWRWVRRVVLGAALFVLGVVLLVTFVPLGGAVKLQAAEIESTNNTAMSSSAMRGSHARVALERIGVVHLSDHPLMQRVALQVTEQLRAAETMGVEQVVLIEGDTWAAEGERLFDLLIVLEMPRHEESGTAMTGRELKATVTAQMGPQAWDSSHGYNDHLTPPVVSFDAQIRLDHTSTTRGYESADARGSLAAADIAEHMSRQVLKKLSEMVGEDGVMPELPAAFYGRRFEPSRELPLPDSPHLRRLYSGPRLMMHNETLWTMRAENPAAVLRPMQDELMAAGWRVNMKLSEQEGATPYLRLSRGADVVEAYVPRPPEPGAAWGDQPGRVVIVLKERFSREQASAAVQELLDAGAPLSQLLMFEQQMSRPQREALAKRAMEEGTSDPELLLSVAQFQDRQGGKEEAVKTLSRAALVAIAREDASKISRRIEEAGRKITGDEKWEPAKPDEGSLRAAGFKRLPDEGEVTAEVALLEPANFYEAGEELKFHSIIVEPSKIPEGVYTLVHRTGQFGSGGANSTSATVHSLSRPWRSGTSFHADGRAVNVEAVEIGDEKFRVTVKREEREAARRKER